MECPGYILVIENAIFQWRVENCSETGRWCYDKWQQHLDYEHITDFLLCKSLHTPACCRCPYRLVIDELQGSVEGSIPRTADE